MIFASDDLDRYEIRILKEYKYVKKLFDLTHLFDSVNSSLQILETDSIRDRRNKRSIKTNHYDIVNKRTERKSFQR